MSLVQLFKRECLGLSVEENRVTVINSDGNILLNNDLEEICIGGHPFEQEEMMKVLVKRVYSMRKRSVFKPHLVLVIPYESEKNQQIYERISNGPWQSVYLLQNYYCAASGCEDIDVRKSVKQVFIYGINNKTYLGIIFAGGIEKVKIIEKPSSETSKDDIKDCLKELFREMDFHKSNIYTIPDLSKDVIKELEQNWYKGYNSKIHCHVPKHLEEIIGSSILGYKVMYSKNSTPIIDGMCRIVNIIQKGELKTEEVQD